MKKITFIMILCTTKMFAQIPNPGFEFLNPDLSTSNWGNIYMWTSNDTIVFDNYWFYWPTADAHTGQFAIELSNALNITNNTVIPGAIVADTDSVYTAWGGFETFPIQYAPLDFAFYYKFFPVNGDIASASLEIFDALMTSIGSAEIIISNPTASYTYASMPVNYAISPNPGGPAAYAMIRFSTTMPGGQATLGTRLLIDDVDFTTTTSINEKDDETFKLYPQPVNDRLNMRCNSFTNGEITISDLSGKIIYNENVAEFGKEHSIDVSLLSPGLYFASLINEKGSRCIAKFIKSN